MQRGCAEDVKGKDDNYASPPIFASCDFSSRLRRYPSTGQSDQGTPRRPLILLTQPHHQRQPSRQLCGYTAELLTVTQRRPLDQARAKQRQWLKAEDKTRNMLRNKGVGEITRRANSARSTEIEPSLEVHQMNAAPRVLRSRQGQRKRYASATPTGGPQMKNFNVRTRTEPSSGKSMAAIKEAKRTSPKLLLVAQQLILHDFARLIRNQRVTLLASPPSTLRQRHSCVVCAVLGSPPCINEHLQRQQQAVSPQLAYNTCTACVKACTGA